MKKRYKLKNKTRFFTFIFSVLLVVFTVFFSTAAHGYKEPDYRTVRVKDGDTLWSIAGKYGKGGDIRKYIYEIKKINNMDDSMLYAGTDIIIPE
jgi:hypothetical protein